MRTMSVKVSTFLVALCPLCAVGCGEQENDSAATKRAGDIVAFGDTRAVEVQSL